MQVKRLTPELAVGPQVDPADVDTIAALGFRSIIVNRPDGEAPDQPDFASIEAAARRHGLDARHVPVVASAIADSDVDKFSQAMSELPKPAFAFCRTGTRSTLLWALSNEHSLTPDERMRIAAANGFDLGAFRDRIARPR